MTKMRILHIHSGMGGGGIETFIVSMASALQDVCESYLFSLAAARLYEGGGMPVMDPPHASSSAVRIAMTLWRHVQSWEPDIIHAHYSDAASYGAIMKALSRRRSRLVIHWHNTASRPSRTPVGSLLHRHAYLQADAILACSRAAAEYHAPIHAVGPTAVRVLYNPVDLSAFSGAAPAKPFRPTAGAEVGDVLGLFLGRLSVQVKGLDVLCEAVRRLPDGLPVRVAIVGPGDREALREELQPPLGVTLQAPLDRPEVPAVLKASDFLLQPSRTEGFPLTIVEAMAAGLPVVASRVGGIPEAVVDGETGILVPPEDPQALADAIQWMVEHPEERAEMGRRGRERAMLFDVTTIAAQLEHIYREVLDG